MEGRIEESGEDLNVGVYLEFLCFFRRHKTDLDAFFGWREVEVRNRYLVDDVGDVGVIRACALVEIGGIIGYPYYGQAHFFVDFSFQTFLWSLIVFQTSSRQFP